MAVHLQWHKERGARYCPLMKEMCKGGWTKSIRDADPEQDTKGCAAWQPVDVISLQDGRRVGEQVFDCSIFGWPPDLLTEVAEEVSHTTASTDKVANQVYKARGMFLSALPASAQKRLIESEVERLSEPNGHPPKP